MNEQPSQVGNTPLPPVSLTPEQEDFCKRLDEWYARYELRVKPSEMYRGALYAMRPECRSNPDWMAQAANSLREILYPFYSREVDLIGTNKKALLEEYGSVRADETTISEMGKVYNNLNGLTHHGNGKKSSIDLESYTIQDFEKLLEDFREVVSIALTRQVDVHSEIDSILAMEPETQT